ncbi:hypothetical protein [Corynebacterium glyciniphilum]|uniref:hypothetical protein n=1 Tax=Corynebacterium glyciniphilum TaxID=1404244 RepID=UPI00264BAFC0|nr:hypothetical protein [Corynebacterium glyciniphilum]MDN6706393.1 hypothetical protein [Corynebacterium glyciniphilum]
MSKLSNADAALRAIYNYNETDAPARFNQEVEAAQAGESWKPGEYEAKMERVKFRVDEEREMVARSAGLSIQDFKNSMSWLSRRGLISEEDWSTAFDLRFFPKVAVEGEDIIDLGLTVEQWYHGPYKRSRYGEGVQRSEDEPTDD